MALENIPRWALAAIRELHTNIERLTDILHLCINGMARARVGPDIVEFLAKHDGEVESEATKERLALAKREADLAEQELAHGFPTLHHQALMTLWAFLEAAIRRLTSDWLANKTDLRTSEAFQRIRVSLAAYESLTIEDRPLFLAELLERELTAGLPYGPDRLEKILAAIGLAGPIPADLRRDLLELAQVRNLHAHRAGLADRRFVEVCPWLGHSVGESVVVTHELFEGYLHAVHSYVVVVLVRISTAFGHDPSPHLAYPAEYVRPAGLTRDQHR